MDGYPSCDLGLSIAKHLVTCPPLSQHLKRATSRDIQFPKVIKGWLITSTISEGPTSEMHKYRRLQQFTVFQFPFCLQQYDHLGGTGPKRFCPAELSASVLKIIELVFLYPF